MKKFILLLGIIGFVFVFTVGSKMTAQARTITDHSRQIAETCDTQDPYSPCFAPGEKADTTDATCDTQDPYSACFAPGEKADGTLPATNPTPTATPKTTKTATPVYEPSYPSQEDILNATNDRDSKGVGLLGALMFSPIVSMILFLFGFLIFIGIIILIIMLVSRRNQTDSKQNKSSDQKK